MTPDANLDPKVAALVSAAFDKSWPFVKTDPELAHVDRQEVRTRLAQNLARIAQGGERDMWRLAKRRHRSAAAPTQPGAARLLSKPVGSHSPSPREGAPREAR